MHTHSHLDASCMNVPATLNYSALSTTHIRPIAYQKHHRDPKSRKDGARARNPPTTFVGTLPKVPSPGALSYLIYPCVEGNSRARKSMPGLYRTSTTLPHSVPELLYILCLPKGISAPHHFLGENLWLLHVPEIFNPVSGQTTQTGYS